MREPWTYWRDAGDARTFFRSVARMTGDMGRWRAIAAEGVDALALPASGHGSGIGDPTANRAIWLADNDDKARGRALAMLGEAEAVRGAAKIVTGTVRMRLGGRYADALELRYLDGLSLRECGRALGIGKDAVRLRCEVACDWCDSQPLTLLFRLSSCAKLDADLE